MEQQTLNHDAMYTAFISKDKSYDGRAYVGVISTGIFCRFTCPARKPKAENCRFFSSISECLEAGFRPCKRCRPLGPEAQSDPVVKALTAVLEKDPLVRWNESRIADMGFDPSTVRRSFKRHFGMTFLEMARQSRLRAGFETLSNGGRVIDAQWDAGFESSSGFRDAFAKLLGEPPSKLSGDGVLNADWIETPIGAMIAVSDKSMLYLLEFIDRKALPTELKKLWKLSGGKLGIGRFRPIDQIEEELSAYFSAESAEFTVPVWFKGSAFTISVWEQLRKIPVGQTRSYKDIAEAVGRPSAVRAVARANGANQLALVIPCHRVIGADGSLTGYGGGLWRKQYLIDLERKLTRPG